MPVIYEMPSDTEVETAVERIPEALTVLAGRNSKITEFALAAVGLAEHVGSTEARDTLSGVMAGDYQRALLLASAGAVNRSEEFAWLAVEKLGEARTAAPILDDELRPKVYGLDSRTTRHDGSYSRALQVWSRFPHSFVLAKTVNQITISEQYQPNDDHLALLALHAPDASSAHAWMTHYEPLMGPCITPGIMVKLFDQTGDMAFLEQAKKLALSSVNGGSFLDLYFMEDDAEESLVFQRVLDIEGRQQSNVFARELLASLAEKSGRDYIGHLQEIEAKIKKGQPAIATEVRPQPNLDNVFTDPSAPRQWVEIVEAYAALAQPIVELHASEQVVPMSPEFVDVAVNPHTQGTVRTAIKKLLNGRHNHATE